MKKLILSLVILVLASTAFSQKIYFAYVQSETGQPFYVRLNDKVHSSTASGYLILSRLHDSTYTIYLGFPGQSNSEQKFTIPVAHKDRGYMLKNFGEKGWGLYDLQSLSIQMSATTPQAKTVADPDVSPFTEILSKAADDPSLKEKKVVEEPKKTVAVVPAVQKEEMAAPVTTTVSVSETSAAKEPVTGNVIPANIKQASEQVVQKKEEEKTANPDVVVTPVKENTTPAKENTAPVKETNAYKPSEVIRQSETSNAGGHDIVFVDKQNDGKTDTIRVQIPNTNAGVVTTDREKDRNEEKKEEKKFLDIPVEPANTDEKKEEAKPEVKEVKEVKEEVKEEPKTQPVAVSSQKEKPVAKTPVVNNCPRTADEGDFLKLRRKMVAADNDDEMVLEARKYFKSTCFTVYQIRNLGNLFLDDEGKYKLYDAAYPYVSDSHNFLSLKLELKESYWVKRFEAILR